jgi:hypothetical protein
LSVHPPFKDLTELQKENNARFSSLNAFNTFHAFKALHALNALNAVLTDFRADDLNVCSVVDCGRLFIVDDRPVLLVAADVRVAAAAADVPLDGVANAETDDNRAPDRAHEKAAHDHDEVEMTQKPHLKI